MRPLRAATLAVAVDRRHGDEIGVKLNRAQISGTNDTGSSSLEQADELHHRIRPDPNAHPTVRSGGSVLIA